jgi:hypothetical protein
LSGRLRTSICMFDGKIQRWDRWLLLPGPFPVYTPPPFTLPCPLKTSLSATLFTRFSGTPTCSSGQQQVFSFLAVLPQLSKTRFPISRPLHLCCIRRTFPTILQVHHWTLHPSSTPHRTASPTIRGCFDSHELPLCSRWEDDAVELPRMLGPLPESPNVSGSEAGEGR